MAPRPKISATRKLRFGRDRIGLRGRVIGLRLQKIGRVLLRLFDGAGAGFDERRVALLLLLREGERRLRLRCLFVGLIDTRTTFWLSARKRWIVGAGTSVK